MKKLLGGVAISAFLAAPAIAADLPARMPVKAAPAPVVAMYNWSGIYIGAHAGYMWGSADWEFQNAPAANTVTDHRVKGFVGGGHAGFNWQVNQFVFGIEGSVSFGGQDGSSTCPNPLFRCDTEVDHFWRVGGRAGIAVGPTGNWLLYGMGGYARARVETGTPLIATGVDAFPDKKHHDGFYFGGGIEWGIAPNWVIGVEAYHVSLGTEQHFAPLTPFVTRNVDLDFTVAQARLSYKFNWGGPVVARY